MGTDNLFHKRKAKDAKSLKRRAPVRSSYDKVLIVCEGEKTEPMYFEGLVDFYELNTANVRIDGKCGSSPSSVVACAIDLYRDEQRKGDPYDRVYCVVDRDNHADFEAAMERLRAQKPVNTFFSIVSVPCFEYWLLCHFTYTRSEFCAAGKRSAGDITLEELRKYWHGYEKGVKDAFLKLKDQLCFAKANARRGLEDAMVSGGENPMTRVYELVEYLQNLKS